MDLTSDPCSPGHGLDQPILPLQDSSFAGQITGVMLAGSLRQIAMTNLKSDESAVVTTTLAIGGMTCRTCERHVLRALEGLTGVIHVAVDLQNAQATVEHLPALVDANSLVTAIRDAGYEARVIDTVADADPVSRRQALRGVCGCGCCGAPKRPSDWANLWTSTIG
jgi:copper chaperone CopZ